MIFDSEKDQLNKENEKDLFTVHLKNKAFFPHEKQKQRSVPGKYHRFTDGRVVFRKGLRVAETMTLEWIKYFWNSSISGQGSDPTVAGLLVPSGAKVPFVHPTGLSGKWARPRWLVLLSPFQSPPHSPCETRDFGWRVASHRCNTTQKMVKRLGLCTYLRSCRSLRLACLFSSLIG